MHFIEATEQLKPVEVLKFTTNSNENLLLLWGGTHFVLVQVCISCLQRRLIYSKNLADLQCFTSRCSLGPLLTDPKSGSWDDYPHDGINIFSFTLIFLMVNQ